MARITWDAPTTYENGTPLPPSAILSYNLYLDGVNTLSFPGVLNPDGSFSHEFDLPPGTYNVELTAVDTSTGLESAKSNTRVLNVPFAPASPTLLSVSA